MNTLPDHLERIGADLERAAGRLAADRRRLQRRVRVVALVAATAAVATGAGLAASGVDLVSWLRSNDPSQASFFVDTRERYDGPAPASLGCDVTAGEPYSCREGRGERRYKLLQRVEPAERVTRAGFHDSLDAAERNGLLLPEEADRIHADIDAVGDDFFARLDFFSSIRGIGMGAGDSRGPLVPPRGVPMLVTCAPDGGVWGCRNLAGAVGVPVGAPIYSLALTDDWVPAPQPDAAAEQPTVEAIWGRELTAAEERLLRALLGPGRTDTDVGSVSEATSTATATTARP